MKTDHSCSYCWVFQIYWHIECSTLTASSFRIWNSSTRIPSPPLALFVPIFAWYVPLVSLIFLKRSLGFPILLFSSVSLHWSLSFLISCCYSLELCIQMGTSFPIVFRWLKLHKGKQGPSTELMICGISHSSQNKLCAHFIYCVVDVICLKNECTVLTWK